MAWHGNGNGCRGSAPSSRRNGTSFRQQYGTGFRFCKWGGLGGWRRRTLPRWAARRQACRTRRGRVMRAPESRHWSSRPAADASPYVGAARSAAGDRAAMTGSAQAPRHRNWPPTSCRCPGPPTSRPALRRDEPAWCRTRQVDGRPAGSDDGGSHRWAGPVAPPGRPAGQDGNPRAKAEMMRSVHMAACRYAPVMRRIDLACALARGALGGTDRRADRDAPRPR